MLSGHLSLAQACHQLGCRPAPRPELACAAFAAAEGAHARVLLDVLAGAAAGSEARIAPALARRSRQVRERLAQLQGLLAATLASDVWDGARVDSLEGELEHTCRTYREIRDEISARHPDYGMLVGQREPLAPDAIRGRVLLPNQVLLEYLVGQEAGIILLVTPERVRVERLSIGADSLAALIELTFLNGAAKLDTYDVFSLIRDDKE